MQNPRYTLQTIIKSAIVAILVIYVFIPASAAKGDWVSEANARIEQIRKRNVQITVIDSNGGPVSNIFVQIDQVRHRFAFGTCLAYGPLEGNSGYSDFLTERYAGDTIAGPFFHRPQQYTY